jgi:mediator of RNA polymerase II transcription subunit 23
MFVGDSVKNEVEKVIRNLRPSFQKRLRFISHHGKEEIQAQTPTEPPQSV